MIKIYYFIIFSTLCTFVLCNLTDESEIESHEEALKCPCKHDAAPVCGSDGKKFTNLCFFNCELKHNHKLKQVPCPKQGPTQQTIAIKSKAPVSEEGDSEEVKPKPKPAALPKPKPKPHVPAASKKTSSEGDSEESKPPSCICTMEYQPVCDNNKNQYPNLCSFKCAHRQNRELQLAPCSKHASASEREKPEPEPPRSSSEFVPQRKKLRGNRYVPKGRGFGRGDTACTCNHEHSPVCGSDGKTYENKCLLECEQKYQQHLTVIKSRACSHPGHTYSSEEHGSSHSKGRAPEFSDEELPSHHQAQFKGRGFSGSGQGRGFIGGQGRVFGRGFTTHGQKGRGYDG